MLVHNFEHRITTAKFQRASIMGSDSPFFVTISNQQKQWEQAADEKQPFFRQSFIFSEEQRFTKKNNMKVYDVRKEGEKYQMVFEQDNNFKFQIFKNNSHTNSKRTSSCNYKQIKIISSAHLVVLNDKSNLQLLKLNNCYDIMNNESSIMCIQKEKYEILRNLHLMKDQKVLFHIGSIGEDLNYQMKCIDIQSQQIEWEIPFNGYSYLMNKVVNINPITFIHGCVNRYENCLRLFDLRVRGTVLNVTRSDDNIWEVLNNQWTGRGSIRPDFDNISKHNKQFQIVGMFSFLSGTYNYSYILDLRRPGNIIPIDYPSQKSLFHVKCFEMMNGNLIAVQRQFKGYSFESAKVSSYELKE